MTHGYSHAFFEVFDAPVSFFDEHGRYLYINPAGAALLGKSREGIVGQLYLALFPDLEAHPFHLAFERVARGETPFERLEFQYEYEGSGLWSRQRIFKAGDAIAVVWENITAQRCAERKLEAARDKAEEATRLKDEFLATLSHELRTPLNAILGYGRMLQANVLDDEQRGKAIDVIVRNAVVQNQLVDDLLDVSRIVSGTLRLRSELVSVHAFVMAACDVVRPSADAKGITLSVDVAPDLGDVRGDGRRLQQVVWNLLTNAVKFTPASGRVRVRAFRDRGSARIEVVDSGDGMAPEFVPFAFDRFRQEDGAITRRSPGLGLGLAIVKSLVELHGGAVEADGGGKGAGATFRVTLPLAEVSATPSRPFVERPSPPSIAGLKVLVVDDEQDARELVQTILEQAGASTDTAASVEEALDRVAQAPPDVIVSDIGMPGRDGYELIRTLRALPRSAGGAIPAVALTAYARSQDRVRALSGGFQSYAPKPVDPDELLLVVASVASRPERDQ